jgi:hypothetical protein
VFYARRINQRFKCPENRIKYNNRKATKIRHSVAHINTPLNQNLRILNELMVNEIFKKFHRQYLLGKGFNFKVLTHYKKVGGVDLPCVYHYAIHPVIDDYVTITKVMNT